MSLQKFREPNMRKDVETPFPMPWFSLPKSSPKEERDQGRQGRVLEG